MPSRRFRTRRRWTNSLLWARVSAFLLLIAAALTGMTGSLQYFSWTLAACVAGAVVARSNDIGGRVQYGLEEGALLLRRNGGVERISLQGLADASLLDRMAARDLVRGMLKQAQEAGRSKVELKRLRERCLRYCTVDIGMRSLTFGLGRQLIDKRPDAKDDLVLIRTVDGGLLLLSPVYAHDLVESINKALHPEVLLRVGNRA